MLSLSYHELMGKKNEGKNRKEKVVKIAKSSTSQGLIFNIRIYCVHRV